MDGGQGETVGPGWTGDRGRPWAPDGQGGMGTPRSLVGQAADFPPLSDSSEKPLPTVGQGGDISRSGLIQGHGAETRSELVGGTALPTASPSQDTQSSGKGRTPEQDATPLLLQHSGAPPS